MVQGRVPSYAQTELDVVEEDLKPTFYERQAGGRRAKLPDVETPCLNNGVIQQTEDIAEPAAAAQLPASRRSRWEHYWKRPKQSEVVEGKEKRKLRHVMLHWGKENVDGAQKLILNATLPSIADRKRSVSAGLSFPWHSVSALRPSTQSNCLQRYP